MYISIAIIFWLCVYFVLHTYVVYPLILKVLSIGKSNNTIVYSQNDDELPFVSFVIAAYNEESVIEEKIKSIFNTTYPLNKFDVHIGSDNSSDNTNTIISNYAEKYSNLYLHAYTERQGKAKIINTLSNKVNGDILILTDANVFFIEDTIYQLVKHYKNKSISLVGGLIKNTNLKASGISHQEKTYLSNENIIKHREGILWGSMVGAFGGVYSIRKAAYRPVPKNYYMDDFYITMHVLKDGGKAIKELNAITYEDVSNVIKEEFRRKVRISIGNFQNLSSFWKLAINPFTGIGFSFISHKILRWFTPFFILACLITSGILFSKDVIYSYLFFAQIGLLLLPIVDLIFKTFKIHISPLRFITHFYSMNLALLFGFFKYVKGIESNVWQPTKRNQ